MPRLDRFAKAKETSTHIRHKYHDVLSSPTRQNVVQLDEVVNESILMKDSYERTVSFAAKRRQKAENTMIRHAVKPLPRRLSVSHADIASAVTKRIDEANAKERKRQKRLVQASIRQEEANLKAEWRATWEGKKRAPVSWKKYKEDNFHRLNYIALQSTPKKAKPLFEFDLGLGNSSFGERLQTQLSEAAESGRGPLSYVRIHQIDGSDSDVEFILDNSDRARLATEDEA